MDEFVLCLSLVAFTTSIITLIIMIAFVSNLYIDERYYKHLRMFEEEGGDV